MNRRRDAEEELRRPAEGVDRVAERERRAETGGWRRDSAPDSREGSRVDADGDAGEN